MSVRRDVHVAGAAPMLGAAIRPCHQKASFDGAIDPNRGTRREFPRLRVAMRGPAGVVLGAEGAAAGPDPNLARIAGPIQHVADAPAVAPAPIRMLAVPQKVGDARPCDSVLAPLLVLASMRESSAPSPPPEPDRIARYSTDTEAAGALRWLPGLRMLRRYDPSWLRHDIVAGLVLTTMLVPVGIAYAEASGVPGIYGLYATIVPLLVYALFGPSRILVLGPDSSLAAVILAVVLPLSGRRPAARGGARRARWRSSPAWCASRRASRASASSPSCCRSRSATAT